jgi:hypothetical protein
VFSQMTEEIGARGHLSPTRRLMVSRKEDVDWSVSDFAVLPNNSRLCAFDKFCISLKDVPGCFVKSGRCSLHKNKNPVPIVQFESSHERSVNDTMSSRELTTFAVIAAVLGLFSTQLVAAQIDLPPTPMWHFAVRTTDESGVLVRYHSPQGSKVTGPHFITSDTNTHHLLLIQVIFPNDWKPPNVSKPFPASWYQVQSSPDLTFEDIKILPDSYMDLGRAYLTFDEPWSSKNAPYYRVVIRDPTDDNIVDESLPAQPFDNKGEYVFPPYKELGVHVLRCQLRCFITGRVA